MTQRSFIPQHVGTRRWNGRQVRFCVWAPSRRSVRLVLKQSRCTEERILAMVKDTSGYWTAVCDALDPGTRYAYELDGAIVRPDPASLEQPDGVHGYSAFVDVDAHRWRDQNWSPPPFKDWVIYELHVGVFTKEGTFDALADKLDHLVDLGVNAVELMPVCAFPGRRNWGYDGVYPFSVHTAYGGVKGLQRLVDTCHRKGLAVILDVVYNHLGPEGNYLRDFGPYFTKKYTTPWGDAINYDDAGSAGVRAFFVQNAIHWFQHFHVDALRLDAIHGIFDFSARHILAEIAQAVAAYKHRTGKQVHLIAESDLNDVRVLESVRRNGFGLDAQWLDDFHHACHTALTKERKGYYQDYNGVPDLAKTLEQGFVYDGCYSSYRRRFFGSSSKRIAPKRFVAFIQNHDQVGNRINGERLSHLVDRERLKTAAVMLLAAPYVPLLFMGEEFAACTPFLYFVDHGDEHLIQAVRQGRKRALRSFAWKGEPPDPAAVGTFERCRLKWDEKERPPGLFLHRLYRDLIRMRRRFHGFADRPGDKRVRLFQDGGGLVWYYPLHRVWVLVNCSSEAVQGKGLPWLTRPMSLHRLIDTTENRYGGPGPILPKRLSAREIWTMPPFCAAVYHHRPSSREHREPDVQD